MHNCENVFGVNEKESFASFLVVVVEMTFGDVIRKGNPHSMSVSPGEAFLKARADAHKSVQSGSAP